MVRNDRRRRHPRTTTGGFDPVFGANDADEQKHHRQGATMNRLTLRHLASMRTVLCRNHPALSSQCFVRPVIIRKFATPSTATPSTAPPSTATSSTATSSIATSSTATPSTAPPAPSTPASSTVTTDDAIHEAAESNVLHTSNNNAEHFGVDSGFALPTDISSGSIPELIVTDASAEVAKLPNEPITAFSRFLSGRWSNKGSDAAIATTESTAANANTAAAVAQTASETGSTSFSDTLLTPAMTILNGVHDVTGLPWWLSIVIATLSIRTALLPFTLMTMKNSAVMAALKDDITAKREAVMEAARSGDRLLANSRQTEMQTFMREAGIAPARVLVGPLVQFPVFISLFVSIRRLAASDPSFTTGGIGWFSDLSVLDPTFVLPVVCGASLFAMTELGGDSGSTAMTPQMKTGMRLIAGLSVPLTYWFPAAVFCYWIPNNIFSVSLGAAMRLPRAKKALGLLIDPATIAGTQASRQFAAKVASRSGSASNNDLVNAATAVASYGKRGRSKTVGEQLVKPVLLKTRPSKKAKVGRNN